MSDTPNVIPLFATDQQLETAWQKFDEAMKYVHHLYKEGCEDEYRRRIAMDDALRAEIELKSVFIRTPTRQLVRA